MTPLDPDFLRLVSDLVALQRQAKALGMFANDRELLECPRCGLMEDVTATGMLITCREPELGHDTGLRFKPWGKRAFRCPACGKKVCEPRS